MQREPFPGDSLSARPLLSVVFLTSFSSRAPLGWTPPRGGCGPAPIARIDRCSRPELSTEPSELSLSAYTLALITSIHMALSKNLGTVLGQIKFTRHSWVAPCLWGDEVTVLQACEGCSAKGGKQQTLSDLHRICGLRSGIFPLFWNCTPEGR